MKNKKLNKIALFSLALLLLSLTSALVYADDSKFKNKKDTSEKINYKGFNSYQKTEFAKLDKEENNIDDLQFREDKDMNLRVIKGPNKVKYKENESFDPSGIKIEISDINGEKKLINSEDFEKEGIKLVPKKDTKLSDGVKFIEVIKLENENIISDRVEIEVESKNKREKQLLKATLEIRKRENKLLINNIDPDAGKIIIKYGKDLENINNELLTIRDNTGIWMQEKENVVHRLKKSLVSSITTVDAVDHILSKEEDCKECSVELLDDYRIKIHIPDSKVENIEDNYIQVTVKNIPVLSNDEVKTESVSEAVFWSKNNKKELKIKNPKPEKNKNREKISIFKEEDRIYGDDRIETAVKLSKKTHRFRSKSVVIVNKDTFSDALVSIPLAHQLDASILFTGPKNLPEATLEEIERLKVKDVYLVGSNQSISKSVESILSSKVEKISRFAGDDRYDTARLVAEKVRKNGNRNTLVIASGENFSDALSISSVATKKDIPILLSKKDDLSRYTKKAIASDYSRW